ncbi:MAG: hypothetical protein ACTSYF_07180 [Promethearchaeota archaeon]
MRIIKNELMNYWAITKRRKIVEALGVYEDGNEIKFAHLKKVKNSIEIVSVEKIYMRKDDSEETSKHEEEKDYDEIFGLIESHGEAESEEPADNVFFKTISQYFKKNLKIGLNISQEDMSFTHITAASIGKTKNIKKKIKHELGKSFKDINNENFCFIPNKEKDYIVFYHNNKLNLMNKVLNIKSTVKNGIKLSLVDVNELSLINLFSAMIDVDNKVSIMIYVGNEFSRILFFSGMELINISQPINHGYNSPELLLKLYGKIIFEQDTKGFEEISNIIITGSGDLSNYENFLKEKFPGSKISKLPFENFFAIRDENKKSIIDSYAIPISLAWKILEGKERNFIDTDFVPAYVRKKEKTSLISWHGYIFIFLLLLSISFLFKENKETNIELKQLKSDLILLDVKINEIKPVAQAADSITKEINWNKTRIELVDSLRSKKMLHSELIRNISKSVANVNSLWINDYSASYENFSLSGNSLYRSRIHRLARTFKEAKINNVNSRQIMEKNIYTFHITGKIPDIK